MDLRLRAGGIALMVTAAMLLLPSSAVGAQELVSVHQFGTAADAVLVDSAGNAYVKGSLPSGPFVRKYDAAGNVVWTRQVPSSRVVVDGAGNLYVAGSVGSDYYRAFVRKYDAVGNEVWTHEFYADSGVYRDTRPSDLVVDPSGSVYVVGQAVDRYYRTSSMAFVRKIDAAGNHVWSDLFGARNEGPRINAAANDVALDAAGNVYVVGFDLGIWGGDAFVHSYDAAGNRVWRRLITRGVFEEAHAVVVDRAGSVLVAGESVNRVALSPGVYFVAKLDAAGNEVWQRQFGTSRYNYRASLAVDAAGNAYVVDPAAGDVLVRKYDPVGTEVWVRQFGTPERDEGRAVAVDRAGRVLVVGVTYGVFAGQTSDGPPDAFVAVLGHPPPSHKDQCKRGGWQRFDVPLEFQNQGDCIASTKRASRTPG